MTYVELEKCCERMWSTGDNSEGATGYFFFRGNVFKWQADSHGGWLGAAITAEEFLIQNKEDDGPEMQEIIRFLEDREYDRKLLNCEMKWILEGPDSGGVRGLFLYGNDLFNWSSDYLPSEELKPISIDEFLNSKKDTSNPGLIEVVKYLQRIKDRR